MVSLNVFGNDVMSILPLTNKGREVLATKFVDSVMGCNGWLFLTHPYYHSQIRGDNERLIYTNLVTEPVESVLCCSEWVFLSHLYYH